MRAKLEGLNVEYVVKLPNSGGSFNNKIFKTLKEAQRYVKDELGSHNYGYIVLTYTTGEILEVFGQEAINLLEA